MMRQLLDFDNEPIAKLAAGFPVVLVAGIVVTVIVVITLIIFAIICCVCCKRNARTQGRVLNPNTTSVYQTTTYSMAPGQYPPSGQPYPQQHAPVYPPQQSYSQGPPAFPVQPPYPGQQPYPPQKPYGATQPFSAQQPYPPQQSYPPMDSAPPPYPGLGPAVASPPLTSSGPPVYDSKLTASQTKPSAPPPEY